MLNENLEKEALLIKELSKTITVIGIEKTMTVLKSERQKNISFQDERVDTLLKMICSEFGIQVSDCLGNSKVWQKKYAIGLCCYFAKKKLGVKMTEISPFFEKSRSLLSKYQTMIESTKGVNKKEKKVIEVKQFIDKNLK
jgi:chromosomal replication initiation ATPase DnaA